MKSRVRSPAAARNEEVGCFLGKEGGRSAWRGGGGGGGSPASGSGACHHCPLHGTSHLSCQNPGIKVSRPYRVHFPAPISEPWVCVTQFFLILSCPGPVSVNLGSSFSSAPGAQVPRGDSHHSASLLCQMPSQSVCA